jgi:hypothetical protein
MAAPLPDYFPNTTVYSLSLIDCPLVSLNASAVPRAKLLYTGAFPFQREIGTARKQAYAHYLISFLSAFM